MSELKFECIVFCFSDVSVQVAVEMPFKIRTIESPTHKLRLKVCFKLNTSACLLVLVIFLLKFCL